MHILFNRQPYAQNTSPSGTPQNAPTPSLNNRGLLIGDGVFTTILSIDGTPQHWAAHCDRLKRDATVFRLSFNEAGLYDAVTMLLSLNSLTAGLARVRITLTRENATFNASSSTTPSNAPSNRIHASPLRLNGAEPPIELITAAPYIAPQTPIRLTIASIPRGIPSLLTQTKHVGYQGAFLSVMEATDKGYDDAIMLNHHGRVTSATTANLFVRVDNQWVTPPISEGALPGIMRQHILTNPTLLNHHGLSPHQVTEHPITMTDIKNANAAVITNCLIGIRPVACIDDIQFNEMQ